MYDFSSRTGLIFNDAGAANIIVAALKNNIFINLLMIGSKTSSHLCIPNLSRYVIFFLRFFQSARVPKNLTFGIPQFGFYLYSIDISVAAS